MPKHLFPIFLVGCGLLLSGCVDAQKDAVHYRRMLDQQVPPTMTPSPYEPLSLQQAMALANQNNEQLGLSGEDYVQALINKNRALAAFLPTVSFQPSFIVAQKPNIPNPAGNVGGITTGYRVRGDTIQQLNAPVVGNINLFRGLGDVANVQTAEAIIVQRRDLLLNLQATILLNVAQAYYQILRSQASVAVLEHSLQLQEARLTDVQGQFRNGLATRLSVAQTRAEVDSTRVTLIQAQSDVRNGRSALALLIGVPAVPNPLADASLVPEHFEDEREFEQRALETREDLRAAAAQLQAARHGIDAAVAQYYPSISLNVEGFLYRDFYSDASKWNALLSANLPIFSAGLIEADVRTAWSQLRQAALNESAVRRQVLNDVQTAYENLQTSRQRIKQLEDEVAAADEAFNQSREAFRNGLAINLDVITAQDQLLNAQLQLTGARFDETIFFLDLTRAIGRLPEVASARVTQPATMP